jgi:hypothetical protein
MMVQEEDISGRVDKNLSDMKKYIQRDATVSWLLFQDVMEVCCKAVVACVELEVCDCFFSGFIFVVFPCSFNVLPLCLVG